MKKILVLVLALVLCLSVSAMAEEVKGDVNGDGVFKVGFSELNIADAWRICQVDSMTSTAEERGYNFIYTNAEYDTEKQVSDVEDLLAQSVDFLFIAPIDMSAIVPALSAAKEAGVPVILLDREADGTWGEDWLTTIIANYIQQGEMAAQWLVDNVGTETELKIVEITGTVGGSDVRDRAQGFRNIVDQYDNMTIIASQAGDWSRTQTQEAIENIIQSTGGDFNVVYCHNDEMALGACLALKAAGMSPGTDVYVLAVDGQKEAVQAVIDGEINAIATCSPRFGTAAFDALDTYLNGGTFEQYIINPEILITKDNAEEQLPSAF